MGGFVSKCCNALITRKNARRCPECGDLLNKPERCEERVVITLTICSPIMEMRADIRDGRQCSFKKGHKTRHRFAIAAESKGKPILLEGRWKA